MKRLCFGFNEWNASDLEAACFEAALDEVQKGLAHVNWAVEKTAPLHAAILGPKELDQQKALIQLLLDAHSPVDALAFVHTAQFKPDLIDLLPELTTRSPKTREHLSQALIELVQRKRPGPIPRLMHMGASPNAADRNGWTALHHVCRSGDLPTFRALTSGPELLKAHSRTPDGKTALQILQQSPMARQRPADAEVLEAELKKIMGFP